MIDIDSDLQLRAYTELLAHGCKYTENGGLKFKGMPMEITTTNGLLSVKCNGAISGMQLSIPMRCVDNKSFVDMVHKMIQQLDTYVNNSVCKIEAQSNWKNEPIVLPMHPKYEI